MSLMCLMVASLTSLTAMAGGDAILLEAKPRAAMRYHAKLAWQEAAPNRVLREGAHVRCAGRCRLRLADGTQVDMSAETEVHLLPMQSVALPRSMRRGRTMGVEVVRGEANILTPPKGLPFRIHGPDGVGAVMLNGRALVRAFSHRLALRVAAQQAFRRAGHKWHRLKERDGTHVLSAKRYLHRPELVTPAWQPGPQHLPVSLATDDQGVLSLAWKAQAASKVEVRVTTLKARRDRRGHEHVKAGVVEVHRRALKGANLRLPLAPGRYRVAVRLGDDEGFWSPWSRQQETAVIRAELPTGARRSAAHAMTLPPGTSVRLLRAPVLEAASGEGGFYLDPKSLDADAARGRVRLRLPGHPSTLSDYAVHRMTLKADVKLTPLSPTWPHDHVTAIVELRDASGRVDPARVHTRTIVKLGKRRLNVKWTKLGHRRRAVIRGRALDGPALLEVIVTDPHGHPLGRAFVEVIGSGPPPGSGP